jgi:alpha-ketoglutaric semialdehyde dehydrogenase
MVLTGKNIIGNSLSGNGKEIFYAWNPATGLKMEPEFYEADENEITAAIGKARNAFQEYRNKSGNDRADFLVAVADGIMALGDELITRCMDETGLPEARLKSERGRTMGQLKLFASYIREGSWVEGRIDRADATRTPPKPDIRSMQKALGPVAIFGASNFPLAFSVAGGDTASALAAGCTVIFKGHPAHPGASEMVASAIRDAIKSTGMPEGTFSMVQGKSVVVGMTLVKHPQIMAVGFTGSYRGGKAIFDAANSRPVPIPVYAEMGSTNPVFILPNALKERMDTISKELAGAVTLGVGQFCTNPGLVLYEKNDHEKNFVEAFSKNLRETAPGVMLTSGIREAYNTGVQKLGRSRGVKTLVEGSAGPGLLARAFLFRTTGDAFLDDQAMEEEVFGPSTLAVAVEVKEQLMRIATQMGGHLTATLHGTEEDLQNYADLIRILEQKVGRLIVNGYPTGVEVSHAMVHGGPFPATTDSRSTSVGTSAINRFCRPVCYQNFPQSILPAELRDANPLKIWRMIDGVWEK